MSKGYLKIFTLKNVPVYVHWTFPIGGLILALYNGLDVYKVIYYTFAYVLLVTVHEMGHMFAALMRGLRVYAIVITGISGECRLQQSHKLGDVFLVYSAGIVAQLFLLLFTVLYVNMFGAPETIFGKSMVNAFTFINAILMIFALAPYRTKEGLYSDGYVLLNSVLDVFRERPERLMKIGVIPPVFLPDTSLLSMKEFHNDDFALGVEILNDNTTPMEFVVNVLMKYFGLERDDAISHMITIHTRGGMLLPTDTLEQAESIAHNITAESQENGHSLTCRAVSK